MSVSVPESTTSEARQSNTPEPRQSTVQVVERVPSKEKDKEKKKKRILTPIQIEFPELFRSDSSIFPSYTNLIVPYDVECRIRVENTIKEYESLFKKEVKSIALQQACAWDGVRVARIFTNGIRVPRYKDPFKPSERKRLNDLLEEKEILFN